MYNARIMEYWCIFERVKIKYIVYLLPEKVNKKAWTEFKW